MIEGFDYYCWASYRRRMLDQLQDRFQYLYKGRVLDIGGRDRGRFRKPKEMVDEWIFVDVEPSRKPDVVANVANMSVVSDASVDVVNAIELFEHVAEAERGLRECYRVLKVGGVMLLAVPFMSFIHGDPNDYQRWTKVKWEKELKNVGFTVSEHIVMGRYFTHAMEVKKVFIKELPRGLRQAAQIVMYPLMDALVWLDKTKWVINHEKLGAFHGGYFIVAQK